MLGKHYETSKKTDEAIKEYVNIGSIDAWAITGEFENISTSGFDKNYETLNRPDDTASFVNKKGVRVHTKTMFLTCATINGSILLIMPMLITPSCSRKAL